MPASVHRLIPFIFVFVWSTGFIVARYAMPYAEPMTFLFLRFSGVVVCMLPVALLWRARWPSLSQAGHIALVVLAKFSLIGLTLESLSLAGIALASITVGTLYQKRYCPDFDLRAGSVIQFGAAALLCVPLMFLFETRQIDWQPALVAALLWSVLALSIGAIILLFIMIRDGAVAGDA